MAFGVSANRSLASRGPSPGFRFALYAILAVTLMYLDQRGEWLAEVRYVLQGAAYPIQLAVSSPSTAWRWMQDSFESRDVLRAENERLLKRQRELEMQAMRYEALARENAQLRGLRAALPPVAERFMIAEVMNVEPNSLRQSVLLNVGSQNGVFKSQAVMDDFGLLGQTTHVGPWSCEVILITDPEHQVPVVIERTGVRTIAVGTGTDLTLPYLPGNADVKVGDLLLTSGLGGVFPQGYPVARVVETSREAVQPLAQIRAVPLAKIDQAREVMLVWFRQAHPAAPGDTSGADLKQGDVRVQPQPAPPKPKPVPTDATTSAAPAASGTAAGKPGPTPSAPASGAASTSAPKAGNGVTPSAASSTASSAPRAPTTPAQTPTPPASGAASASAPKAGNGVTPSAASSAAGGSPAPADVERPSSAASQVSPSEAQR
jgi:rod shape-determining protein MreC